MAHLNQYHPYVVDHQDEKIFNEEYLTEDEDSDSDDVKRSYKIFIFLLVHKHKKIQD
jgi:hypothetical protein